jgi:hypothetical protein
MKINYSRFLASVVSLLLIAIVLPKLAAGLLAVGLVFGLTKSFTGKSAMPTNAAYGFVISDTTYAGEAAAAFIMKAITGADTIDSKSVYIRDGIKKKFTIPRWDADYEDLIQDRAATPTSKGTMTIDGQAITPQDYMIYTEFNPRDFEAQWMATQLNPTLIDRSLPYSAESVVVQGVLQRHAKYFNKQIWNGDSTLAAPSIYRYFDGFLKKASLAAGTVQVSTPVTLTLSNIQAEMLRGYNVIPLALRYDPGMKYFVSYATYDLYDQSQIAQTYKGVDITQMGKDTFKGKKVVRIADFPDNAYMIAKGMSTPESNLWIGMNSIADEGLKLAPLQANSEIWFIKMLMKVDVQFGWNEETVLYGTF